MAANTIGQVPTSSPVPDSKPATDPDPGKSAEVSAEQDVAWDNVGTLFDILYEHDTALLLRTGSNFDQIAKEDTLETKGGSTMIKFPDGREAYKFEYAEHRHLGDSLILPEHNASQPGKTMAQYNPLTLDNGLVLTYGEVNGLAGDFFGATNPISSGTDLRARKQSFLRAYGYLATSAAGKKKAEALQQALKAEVDKVNDAIIHNSTNMDEVNKQVQEIYKKLPFDLELFDKITSDGSAGAVYTALLKANLDHFGEHGRMAYNAGHACALEEAAKGGPDNLIRAYAMNAFADHFLEDNFAAGHLRVPRKATTSTSTSKLALLRNLSANVMHEEDGGEGLKVVSPAGKSWTCYGDAKLFQTDQDSGKAINMEQCRDALKQSVKEVHEAYKNRKVIAEDKFGVWQLAPDIKKIYELNPDHHPLLFIGKDGKLYTRDGGPMSKHGTCMDDHWAATEMTLWLKFYWQNKKWVGEKLWKYLELE